MCRGDLAQDEPKHRIGVALVSRTDAPGRDRSGEAGSLGSALGFDGAFRGMDFSRSRNPREKHPEIWCTDLIDQTAAGLVWAG